MAGNTKIASGSSETFTIALSEPAESLTITPTCTSSAVTFIPATLSFLEFQATQATFTVSAAVGLNGTFEVSFGKSEPLDTYYNDVESMNITVEPATTAYSITVEPFRVQSIG